MAVPPIIPTSFVPHSATAVTDRRSNSFGFSSILSTLAYLFLLLTLLSAAAVFVYDRILVSEQAGKDAQLATAVSSLNQSTINQFLRLSNRFTSAKTLLDGHIALSGLFNLLESVTPANVSFSSLSVAIDDSGVATIDANGIAKSFNTLAIASNDFGTDAQLKNVIFSSLAIEPNGAVTFVLSATLDPALIAYTGTGTSATIEPAAGSIAPVATTTTTTTSTPTTPPIPTTLPIPIPPPTATTTP